jgi:hypothetical protein
MLENEVVAMAERRRRASSRVTMGDAEGGHIPFTHHVPVGMVQEPDEEGTDPESDPEVITSGTVTTAPANGINTASSERNDSAKKAESVDKRNRLSQLFHIKRKKSSEGIVPVPQTQQPRHHLKLDHKSDAQKLAEKQKAEREQEMKRKEHERYEAELAQGEYSAWAATCFSQS